MPLFKIALIVFIIGIVLYTFYQFKKSRYFPIFLHRLDRMLIEDKKDIGIWSSQRFAFLTTLFFANVSLWGSFVFIVIWTEKIPNIPETIVFLYFGAIGIASYFKYKQRAVEQDFYQENLNERNNEEYTQRYGD